MGEKKAACTALWSSQHWSMKHTLWKAHCTEIAVKIKTCVCVKTENEPFFFIRQLHPTLFGWGWVMDYSCNLSFSQCTSKRFCLWYKIMCNIWISEWMAAVLHNTVLILRTTARYLLISQSLDRIFDSVQFRGLRSMWDNISCRFNTIGNRRGCYLFLFFAFGRKREKQSIDGSERL